MWKLVGAVMAVVLLDVPEIHAQVLFGAASPTALAFDVRAYGAKCDGAIVYGGVTLSTSNTTVSTPTHSFTSADVGATITLWAPPFNSHQSTPLTAFASTIASVSGGNATLAATPSFSSSTAGAFWYHTVDTTAMQAAINAASANAPVSGGGWVQIPQGVCVTGQLTMPSFTRIVGAAQGGSTIALANGSNSDLFIGAGYNMLVGSNNNGGIHDFGLQNLQLFGNRAANTGSGIGNPTGTGDAIRVYGYQYFTDNLLVNYFAGDGLFSEWGTSGGSPEDSNGNIGLDGMESHVHDVKFAYNAGWAMVWGGPHDAIISHVIALSNGTGGLWQEQVANSSAGPLRVDHFHGYQNGGADINGLAGLSCNQCYAEDFAITNGYQNSWIDSGINVLYLGSSGSGAVYQNQFIGTVVLTLDNINGTGSGDQWVNSNIGAFSGSSYTPSYSINTIGQTNVVNGSVAVSCSGTPSSSYAVVQGIVTHC